MPYSWINDARSRLLQLQNAAGGWSYRPGGAPFTEPTAWAALALRATASDPTNAQAHSAELDAAGWLARLQQSNGALGPGADVSFPHWPTASALLCWGGRERFSAARAKAVDWLITHQGRVQTSSETPFGHDGTIPGWPWVEHTHAWLEPTAMAVLALRQQGRHEHQRVRDGLRLLRDRAIRTGGWNYGNSSVFGTDLRPQPAPTGLALLALSGTTLTGDPIIDRGCAYLEKILPTTRSPQSLCWGLLGLSAWERRPSAGHDWLSGAYTAVDRRSELPIQLAYLLLASSTKSLTLIFEG